MRNWANRSESSDDRMHMIHLYQKLPTGKHPELFFRRLWHEDDYLGFVDGSSTV